MDALWWQMPGPRAFVERLCEGFRRGVSAVISMPEPLPEGLRPAVFTQLALDRRPRLHLRYPQQATDPFGWLCESLGIDETHSIRKLIAHERLVDHAIWIDGVDTAHWTTWRRLLESHADAARDLPEHRRPVFCVPVAAPEPPLATDLLIDKHPWKDRVREFDMLLYVASLLGEDALNPRRHALRLALIAELAGSDPALAGVLKDCSFAQLLDAEDLCAQIPALSRLEIKEVNRRIWNAQIRQLFPLLEAQRLQLIKSLDGPLRRAYEKHKQRLTPTAEREDDYRALGFGEICYLLYQCESIGGPWQSRLHALRCVRNLLAHQRPVPEAQLEPLLSEPA